VNITGPSARVAWSYATAAEVRNFSIRSEKKTLRVRASVVAADAYALTQAGLILVTPVGRWQMSDVTVDAGVLTARLGTRESST
jgi:hypothetical protein